jgi:hypothetical protein
MASFLWDLIYSFSITIADAPPPPLHIEARPFSPVLSWWTKWVTMRAPEIPIWSFNVLFIFNFINKIYLLGASISGN